MVQNRSNQPGVERYSNPSFSFTKTRTRSNPRPIQPLKLPALPKTPPPPAPPPSSQSVAAPSSVVLQFPTAANPAVATNPVVKDSVVTNPVDNDRDPAVIESAVGLQAAPPVIPLRLPTPKSAKSAQLLQSVSKLSQSLSRSLSVRVAETAEGCQTLLPQLLPLLTENVTGTVKRLKPKAERSWWVISLSILGSVSGITGLAFLWLASPPPSVNCKTVTVSSPEVPRFYCAQMIAQSGELPDLLTSLELVEQWSPEQPLYADTEQAVAQWSEQLLMIARHKIAANDLEGAIAVMEHIPTSSSVYAKAQTEIASWQQEWEHAAEILETAQAAIKAQNWQIASQQVLRLGDLEHHYWQVQQADVLAKQIVREKQARQALIQAQKTAKENDPATLGAALVLLQQVAPDSQAAPEAHIAQQEWSHVLITYALKAWHQGDTPVAFDLAIKIPLDASLPRQGQDLIRFAQASQLEGEAAPTAAPTAKALWQLWEAVAIIEAISPDSPLYAEAQTAKQTWKTRLEDMTQLSWATWIASAGNRSALQLATAQAHQIAADRPLRSQAQTLIAQWQRQMDSLVDQPYIARAQQWAALGTIANLQAAIAQAREIPSDRAAAQQAQTLIAQWTAQIQTIEDQPIWDQAQKLAKQGKLSEAITVAAKIRPNRALYAQAQAGIANWNAQIQAALIAEDQAILDRAYGLAASQRLTMAVDVASQITPDRPLYGQAQSIIKAWLDERNAIWKSWWAEPSGDSDSAAESSVLDGESTAGDAGDAGYTSSGEE